MSRSFFNRSSSPDSSNGPLLPQHRNSVSLNNLSPRESLSPTQTRSASPSPPPSFYRTANQSFKQSQHAYPPESQTSNYAPSATSLSPTRSKTRKIQFVGPPPPIASSVLLPPTQYAVASPQSRPSSQGKGRQMESSFLSPGGSNTGFRRRGSGAVDPLLGLERREKAIQAELQLLLDAQSAGLVQGFGGGGVSDAGSEAGSSTPTTTSRSLQRERERGGIMPVRQPKRKVIGLRGARRGLLRDMGELVSVKTEEVRVLNSEIGTRMEVLQRVGQWENRIESTRALLSGYSGPGHSATGEGEGGGEEAMEIAELRTEEKAVDNEIREMEDRLAQMKARKRWLGERIQEGVNRREARLSSYRGALREVESEVKEFLRRPPIPISIVMGEEESFVKLPAGRRTLGMAKEWWSKEISKLEDRRQEVEKEKAALEEGAKLWSESIATVTAFEDELRKQMTSPDVQNTDMLKAQVEKMGDVIKELGKTVSVAEERGWNLLICAVGAEMEAFREGEGILRGALEMAEPEERRVEDDGESVDERSGREDVSHGNGIEGLDLHGGREGSHDSEDQDDAPDLDELLIDRGD